MELYESLRKQILEGSPRPQGLSVILYHGVMRGLQMLIEEQSHTFNNDDKKEKIIVYPVPLDTNLVRFLANMILHKQSEIRHVY